jgi:hypothetical protein
VACVLLLVLNTGVIYTPAPWLLAAGEEVALRGGEEEIDKKIKIAGIIIIASCISSSAPIILNGVVLEAFVGRPLCGVAAFWLSLGFLLLANWKIVAGLVKLAVWLVACGKEEGY